MIRNDAIAKLMLEIALERETKGGGEHISWMSVWGFKESARERAFTLTDECVAGTLEDLHKARLLILQASTSAFPLPAYRISAAGRAHLAATTANPVPTPEPEPAKPFFTSFVSEAALDGWWDTVDMEIKVELFNHFYGSLLEEGD